MKRRVLTLALAAVAACASAEDGWVSVGATRVVAPASPQTTPVLQGSPVLSAPMEFSSPSPSGDLVSELMQQVEQMQSEIATLRGRVEEQGAKLARMEQEQQDRYLDLDSRVSTLVTSGPSVSLPPSSGTSPAADLPPSGDAYKAAMELVRAKQFVEAGAAFDTFATNYPQDPLLVNALYWAGEVNLVDGRLDIAEQRFRRVISEYPDHTKAADAAYKLGVTLHKAGKNAEARQVLQGVVSKYAGVASGTVALAKSYLEKVPAQ